MVVLGLSVSIYYLNGSLSNTSTNNHQFDNDGIGSHAGDAINDLSLNCSFPTVNGKVETYRLLDFGYTVSDCKSIINQTFPNWLNENVLVKQTNDGNSTLFSKGKERVSIFKSGGLLYGNDTATQSWTKYRSDILSSVNKKPTEANPKLNTNNTTANNDTPTNETIDKNQSINIIGYDQNTCTTYISFKNTISFDDAYNISINFIKQHGGLPDDYYLAFKTSGKLKTHNYEFVDSYILNINRKINGCPIVGRGGEGAKLWITPLGDVAIYQVLWRNISTIDENISTISASTAFTYLKSKCNSNANLTMSIEHIELGYYSDDFETAQELLKPVWIYYTDKACTHYIIVDAIGMKYYEY